MIVCVVDADGRIAADGPGHVAGHFVDPGVGGVQSLVRIYNRESLLARMQDIEFGVYGHVYQAGRNGSGTAGMGGNGQFNRLSALDAIATGAGPWRNRLTEDQDLGLRLLTAGWRSHQELRAVVEQQGVPRVRPLLRQRTRWSQGNLQAFDLIGAIWRSPFPRHARVEEVAYLLMPVWQAIIGLAVICAGFLVAFGDMADHLQPRADPVSLRDRLRQHRAQLPRLTSEVQPARTARDDRHRARLRALHVAAVPGARACGDPPAEGARRLESYRPRAASTPHPRMRRRAAGRVAESRLALDAGRRVRHAGAPLQEAERLATPEARLLELLDGRVAVVLAQKLREHEGGGQGGPACEFSLHGVALSLRPCAVRNVADRQGIPVAPPPFA